MPGDREESRTLPHRGDRRSILEVDLAANAVGSAEGLVAGATRRDFPISVTAVECSDVRTDRVGGGKQMSRLRVVIRRTFIEINPCPPIPKHESDAVEYAACLVGFEHL